MPLRSFFISILLLCSCPLMAQDKICKKNGDVIQAKVKKLTDKEITYRKYEDPDGPDRVIDRREVTRIEYEDHRVVPMHPRKQREKTGEHVAVADAGYGLNMLCANLVNIGNSGVGLGISYERVLDKAGYLGFILPVNFSLAGYKYGSWDEKQYMMILTPGIKYYPRGNNGKLRYAAGAHFRYEKGYIPEEINVTGVSWMTWKDKDVLVLGGMVFNSLNITSGSGFFTGIDLGCGYTFLNRKEDALTTLMVDRSNKILVELNVRVGWRF